MGRLPFALSLPKQSCACARRSGSPPGDVVHRLDALSSRRVKSASRCLIISRYMTLTFRHGRRVPSSRSASMRRHATRAGAQHRSACHRAFAEAPSAGAVIEEGLEIALEVAPA